MRLCSAPRPIARRRSLLDRHFAIDWLAGKLIQTPKSYERTQAAQVARFLQRVVEGAIGTRSRDERHLTHVDGFDGAKRARSGSHGEDRDRDSAPNAGSRSRLNDQPLPRRRTREIRRKSGMVQSKVTPTIVAGVCDPGVDNCRPQRDRLQAGPITACAMIPSVTQEWVFLNHAEKAPLSATFRSRRTSR